MFKKFLTFILATSVLVSCSKDPIEIVHSKFISLDSKGVPHTLYKVSNFVSDDRFDYEIFFTITKLNSPFELDGKQYFNYGFFVDYNSKSTTYNPISNFRYIKKKDGEYYLSNERGMTGAQVFPAENSTEFDDLSDICNLYLFPYLCQE